MLAEKSSHEIILAREYEFLSREYAAKYTMKAQIIFLLIVLQVEAANSLPNSTFSVPPNAVHQLSYGRSFHNIPDWPHITLQESIFVHKDNYNKKGF